MTTTKFPTYNPLNSPTTDRVMTDARAASFTKRSIKTSAKLQGLRLAVSMVDLTTLEGNDTPEKVKSLCKKAIHPYAGPLPPNAPPIPHVAALCVYPNMVKIAAAELKSTTIHIASVATAFPSGQYPLAVRLADVENALAYGADEIDMVINRSAFLAGRYDEVAQEIREVKQTIASRAHLKIIFETGELETYDNIRRMSDLAINAAATASSERIKDGEIFIKTSTGKVSPAATLPVTLIMLQAIRDHYLKTGSKIGMKPAGGIRTAKQALHYLVAVKETLDETWLNPTLFRFGASSLLNDLLRQIIKQQTGTYPATHDFSSD
ncbi:MAG: deoxyribose-phosphate aldolase [Rhodocyclales bacterium CG_4_9_14_3_um_filter_68_10]|nr:MAG: deoxyribose-phosphate aldolase [Rhodocyclales bacterium CG_4_9_14_3_um_filter_68_10]